MVHTFAEIITHYCDKEGITQAEISKKINWRSGQINPFFKGHRRPVYEFIALFIQFYPNCNPRWLLTGIGEMKLSSQNGDYIPQISSNTEIVSLITNELIERASSSISIIS